MRIVEAVARSALFGPDQSVTRQPSWIGEVDERRVAEWLDVDLVIGTVCHAGPFGAPLEKLLLTDTPPVRECAGEVIAEVLPVPGRVGFDEGAVVVCVQVVEVATASAPAVAAETRLGSPVVSDMVVSPRQSAVSKTMRELGRASSPDSDRRSRGGGWAARRAVLANPSESGRCAEQEHAILSLSRIAVRRLNW